MAPAHNVLHVIVDDLRLQPGATPELERFASTALRFERAYAQVSLCGPSRASFFTGRRPAHTGILPNGEGGREHFRDPFGPNLTTVSQVLKQGGWWTAGAGKTTHAALPKHDVPYSWHEYYDVPKAQRAVCAPPSVAPEAAARCGGGCAPSEGVWCELSAAALEAQPHEDSLVTRQALRWLGEAAADAARRPFYVAVGLRKPHTPYAAPLVGTLPPPTCTLSERSTAP